MKILHLSLGLPPFRTGGLTRYAVDLAGVQARQGHDVSFLYPGCFGIVPGVRIIERAGLDFVVHEIANPLPVAIPLGIRNPNVFVKSVAGSVYSDYLQKIRPDVIHVHTLMGVHKEFFSAAKKVGIKIVMTTHDYFGLCPRAYLVNLQGGLCSNPSASMCAECCATGGLPLPFVYAVQTRLYERLKHTGLFRWVRNYRNLVAAPTDAVPSMVAEGFVEKVLSYEHLRSYYRSILRMVDRFHFNSKQTESIYARYLDLRGKVIPVLHGGIKDNRRVSWGKIDGTSLRIGFIGNRTLNKGVSAFFDAIRLLLEQGCKSWVAYLHGDEFSECAMEFGGKVISRGKFDRGNLRKVFSDMDLLVVPSIRESFGFVVLEALSYGVPVLVSEGVGALDLLKDAPIEIKFKPNGESLFKLLKGIIESPSMLQEYQSWICNSDFPLDMNDHVKQLFELYNESD